MPRDPIKLAFSCQKSRAKKRGIVFQFTFQQWVQWWEHHLGPDWFGKRGVVTGQYVMARNNDSGPYHPSNVRCVLCATNHRERSLHLKFSKSKIRSIFLDTRPHKTIAKECGLSPNIVGEIKRKQLYADVTAGLQLPVRVVTMTKHGRVISYR